jgi:UDP-N-acetylglucosamine 2-epimerase (non-hydrolysing)
LVAKNKKLELFHVESGLRSRNMEMPEERNRIVVDSISDYLFAPSDDAVDNLIDENIDPEKIFSVGNIMIDTLKKNYEKIKNGTSDIIEELKIENNYFVTTIHRPSNLTDENLNNIFNALSKFTNEYSVILPAHPRLRKYIEENSIKLQNVSLIDPMSYIEFLSLVSGSALVLTDSGGLQEETTFMNINCLTLRNETERPITVELGTNKVVGLNTENIISEINNSLTSKLSKEIKIKNWDGNTSERIFNILYK